MIWPNTGSTIVFRKAYNAWPAAVRSFAANRYGLFDMEGNVSEWVEDCWHDNYTRAPRDSAAWVNPGCERRVVRGGSWWTRTNYNRSACRHPSKQVGGPGRIGFRVVCTVPTSQDPAGRK